jgi:hypothetical protein
MNVHWVTMSEVIAVFGARDCDIAAGSCFQIKQTNLDIYNTRFPRAPLQF